MHMTIRFVHATVPPSLSLPLRGRTACPRCHTASYYPDQEFYIEAHAHQPVQLIRQQIASKIGWEAHRTKMTVDTKIIMARSDGKRLAEVGIGRDCTVHVRQAAWTNQM